MIAGDDQSKQANKLRRQAEEAVFQKVVRASINPETMSTEEIRRIVHELQVYQLELEMQNDELLQAQEKLERERTRYFELYDLAPVGYCTVSFSGLILQANLAAADLLGVTRGALLRQPISKFIVRKDQDIYYLHKKQLFATGKPQTCELRIAPENRAVFWAHLESNVAMDKDGAPVSRIIFSDVPERKRAEEKLQEANELLSLLMKYSPIFVFIKEVTSQESRVLIASENFQEMVGIPGSKMVGKTMQELFPAEFAAKITDDDWSVVSEDRVIQLDEDLHDRNYTTIKFPISSGEKNRLAGFTIDITKKKQLEIQKAKLEAENGQLQKSESLGKMAGAIAHTFNNKLGVVLGNLELALQELPREAPGLAKRLTFAMEAAREAAEVSGHMLTYLGQTAATYAPLDLSLLCRQYLQGLKAAVPKNLILKIDLQTPGPIISANGSHIVQVLSNLFINAREAIGENQGAVGLHVGTVSEADVQAVQRFSHDLPVQAAFYACLEITDTGCGIAQEDIEKLFDPFYSSKFTGRGLGLAVVSGIVKAHDGVMVVESEMGQGSTFRAFFPVIDQAVVKK